VDDVNGRKTPCPIDDLEGARWISKYRWGPRKIKEKEMKIG
jgi:hypothetical protein